MLHPGSTALLRAGLLLSGEVCLIAGRNVSTEAVTARIFPHFFRPGNNRLDACSGQDSGIYLPSPTKAGWPEFATVIAWRESQVRAQVQSAPVKSRGCSFFFLVPEANTVLFLFVLKYNILSL
jgi:hypothetical protein